MENEENSSGSGDVAAGFCGADEDVICDGKYVVVERGDQQRIFVFKANQTISFGKGSTQQDILLKGALGSPFLTAFKASPAPAELTAKHVPQPTKKREWKRSGKPTSQNLFTLEKSGDQLAKSMNEFYQLPESVSSGTDNRHIVDDNTSQALRKHDIISLREQGVPSKEILDTLITSSKSFGQKTEFAQEKYLKKKEKIYGDVLVFRKPSISILAEYYFKRDTIKVLGLRTDTLSQILSYANIHANGKYLIYENCCGLIVAAVLQRMGGLGTALHCHIGSNPQRQALIQMNFADDDLKPMKNLDITYLMKGNGSSSVKSANLTEDSPLNCSGNTEEPKQKRPRLEAEVDSETEKNGKDSSNEDNPDVDEESSFVTSSRLLSSNNREDNVNSLAYLNETEFDGLVICGKEHPLSLFQKLVTRLGPSAPFVIYGQYVEPLMDCYVWAKEKGLGVNVHLVDNWLRNIQVETDRTHPEINMSPSGGYLLYGTYTGAL